MLRRGEEAPLAPTPAWPTSTRSSPACAPAGSTSGSTQADGAGTAAGRVELAAYRIVQEALTNVARHAHARHGHRARLRYDDGVTVEVTDDGVGGAGRRRQRHHRHARAGRGARAARSRPARAPGGGFRVAAPTCRGRRAVITVVIADDQALVRGGFRALLDAQDDITVVGEAATATRRCAWPSSCAPTSC